MALYLRDDFKAALGAGALREAGVADLADATAPQTFEALFAIRGEVRRQALRRRTLRVAGAGSAYYAKLHDGVGWGEIFKNLLTLKRPVLGARNEFRACRRLRTNGVRAPAVAAFGEMGRNPATRRSLVVCDALGDFVSLEDIGNAWHAQPPAPALKRRPAEGGRRTDPRHARLRRLPPRLLRRPLDGPRREAGRRHSGTRRDRSAPCDAFDAGCPNAGGGETLRRCSTPAAHCR